MASKSSRQVAYLELFAFTCRVRVATFSTIRVDIAARLGIILSEKTF